jgi:hypothetical protein
MRIKNLELWAAFGTMIVLGAGYGIWSSQNGLPKSSGLAGHLIGVVGFLLMLMTEILYSVRKSSPNARWGKLQHWLAFHVYTGLVGPFLVLLHTAWRFNGIAGILTLLMVIIVLSGFVGRFFYTQIPRDEDGQLLPDELVPEQQEQQIRGAARTAKARRLLAVWHAFHVPFGVVMFTIAFIHIGAALYYATLVR